MPIYKMVHASKVLLKIIVSRIQLKYLSEINELMHSPNHGTQRLPDDDDDDDRSEMSPNTQNK